MTAEEVNPRAGDVAARAAYGVRHLARSQKRKTSTSREIKRQLDYYAAHATPAEPGTSTSA
jgi:hypothetical protein